MAGTSGGTTNIGKAGAAGTLNVRSATPTTRFTVAGSTGVITHTPATTTGDAITVDLSTLSSGNGLKLMYLSGTLNGGKIINIYGGTGGDESEFSVGEGGVLTAKAVGNSTDATDAVTVGAAHYGTVTFLTHADTVAVTLPDTVPAAGTWCDFILNGNDSLAVTFATETGADDLIAPNNATADSVTFGAGHRIGAAVRFISNGTSWIAINIGSTTLTVTDAG